ncbi:MAG: hypothetical protein KatS3mg124_1943 [Porticoccaceae bacterium]|nr:MAG: hypothetical protein KatS3mg124_1943 [Porticoccaceae bacterium]
MITAAELAAAHPFLAGLDPERAAFLAGCARLARFRAGEFLTREGQAAESCFLLLEGRVSVEIHVPGGGARPLLTARGGEVVGWSWLVPPFRYRFDARALVPTRALSLAAQCVRTKCEDDPRLGYLLLKRLAAALLDRLQEARLQLADLYAAPAGGRR